MSAKTQGKPPLRHVASDLQNLTALAQKQDINGKVHPECMYRFTGSDPQSLAWRKFLVLQQPGPPLGAGIGYLNRLAEHDIFGHVFDLHDLL